MIKKIITNLELASDIVLTAQSLVNEQFRLNAYALGVHEKTVKNHLKEKNEKFRTAVQSSPVLLSEEKQRFAELNSDRTYEVARGIILKLTKREIKNPRA